MSGLDLRRRSVAVALVVALAVGCTSGDDEPPSEDGQATDGAATEPAAPEEVGPHGRLQLTGWAEDHPKVVTVALRAIEVDGGGNLLIDVEAVNSGDGGASMGQRGVLVRDDLGNVYGFVRPEDNDRLQFDSDERMTGTLAFEGPVDPEARSVTVAFNQQDDGEPLISAAEDNLNQFPRFLFEGVPLPGVGLEAEADRGGSAEPLTTEQEVEVDVTVQPEINQDVTVTVVRYRTDGRTVTVELEAVNRSDVRVELVSATPFLRDGQDDNYTFEESDSEDIGERVLRMEPGEELSAVLAWRGIIPEDAEFLTMELNSANRQTVRTPHVSVDLPLPEQDR